MTDASTTGTEKKVTVVRTDGKGTTRVPASTAKGNNDPASATADPKKKAAPKKPSAKKSKKAADGPAIGSQFDLNLKDIVVDKGANPRQTFDRETLNSMAATIKNIGIMNPLSVYLGEDNKYHLIAGERRLRASKIAGLKKVPVRLFENDPTAIEYARLVENMYHDKLNPLEEAQALKRLLGRSVRRPGSKEPITINAKILAEMTKKTAGFISQRLALLDLPKEIQTALMKGKISFAHTRELTKLTNPEAQLKVYREILKGGGAKTKDVRKAVDKSGARKKRSNKGKKAADDGEVPNIARQSLETALERLRTAPISVRKKTEMREGLGTAFERYDGARSDEKKTEWKGVVKGLEYAAGLRDDL